EFHACDLNETHIHTARQRASAFGISNVHFHHAAFQELQSRKLPAFDYIAVHGVYSWVAPEARQAIRQIIAERLEPGGLVYLSYNCLPGWMPEIPLRKLLLELAAGQDGDTEQRVEYALQQLKELSGGKLRYFKTHPSALAAIDSYVSGPARYLIHEFLNQTWEPFYSIDVADEMAGIGTNYVGSATLPDNHPALLVPEQAGEAVARLATRRQRQIALDFAVDRRFRRDVFVRGPGSEEHPDSGRYLSDLAIGCLGDPDAISTQLRVPRGMITFQNDFIRDLQTLMSRGSLTTEQAVASFGGKGKNNADIMRNLAFLVAGGVLMPFAKAISVSGAAKAEPPANRTIERMLDHVIERRMPPFLPSEVVGNGVPLTQVEALTIKAWLNGNRTEETLAARLNSEVTRLGLEKTTSDRDAGPIADAQSFARRAAREALEKLLPNMLRLGLLA
ncbi:MAG TPA: methyltransferase regulatory domain-containing protein, partial [Candidatus Angelobacter sp.]|nr:methyltransferase regulatory domain-containing protein [Candidatus Angelobacter sp.]